MNLIDKKKANATVRESGKRIFRGSITSCPMHVLHFSTSADFCRVSFAKDPYKRDDILQKRPIIVRSLLIVATPYSLFAESWHICIHADP